MTVDIMRGWLRRTERNGGEDDVLRMKEPTPPPNTLKKNTPQPLRREVNPGGDEANRQITVYPEKDG